MGEMGDDFRQMRDEKQKKNADRLKLNTEIVLFLAGELDYEVKQHSEVHMSLFHPNKRRMDYWPSTSKAIWFIKGEATKSFFISDIEQYIYSHFGEAKKQSKPDKMENKNLSSVTEVLSKRELIAMMAPDNIPDWFVHTPVDLPVTPSPKLQDIKIEEDRKIVEEWLRDPIYDLPDHLQWFADAKGKRWDEVQIKEKKDQESRYFQWRRYYAEQLLAELNKQPEP